MENADIIVIGAGPAGTVASAALVQSGHRVICLERGFFPRPVIGESLLPRCNTLLKQVGLLSAVESRGYQAKHGALFLRGEKRERFAFAEALGGDGPSTWQVPRDDFDQTLATAARQRGADLRFGHEVRAVVASEGDVQVSAYDSASDCAREFNARFVLDCSGYGRVLPRLFGLERDTDFPARVASFVQFEGDIRPTGDKAGDIWICTHPAGGWIWIIPFSNGRTSVGAVCAPKLWDGLVGTPQERLLTFLKGEPNTAARLAQATPVTQARTVRAFAKRVSHTHGPGWALAGNASEFLDPIFSSGVALAMESAVLASDLIDRQLKGENVDWLEGYDTVLSGAVRVFRAFVEAWYRGDLETIFHAPTKAERTKRRITSILGGSVMRTDNPFVVTPVESLKRLHGFVVRG